MSGIKYKFDPTAPSTLVPAEPTPVAPIENPAVPNQTVPSTEPIVQPTSTVVEPAPTSVVTEPTPAATEPAAPVVEPTPPVKPTLSEDDILAALRDKYKDQNINSLADLMKPAPAAAPDLDEDTQKYLRFKKETGRSMNDWMALNQDLTKSDPLQLAKERIIEENAGIDLTPQEINFLLEDKLGFDPTDPTIDDKEKALFKQFYGAQLKQKLAEQQKYNTPIDGYTPNSQPNTQPDTGAKVKLSNGLEVDEESYNRDRQNYLTQRSLQVEALTEEKFVLAIDTKDGKVDLGIDYAITPDDKRKMLSMTDDLGSILEKFTDPQTGQLNHADLNKKLLRIDDEYFNKLLSVAATKIRSEVISELTGQRRNVQLNSPNTPPAPIPNKGYATIGQNTANQGGQAVKFAFQNNNNNN
jgi:hypothetical protein